MPKINLVKQTLDDPSSEAHARMQQELAKQLLGSDAAPKIQTPAQGAVHVAGKALGAWLMRSAMDDEKRRDEEAWSPLKSIVDRAASETDDGGASVFGSTPPPAGDAGPAPRGPLGPLSPGGRSGGGSRAMAASERAKQAYSFFTNRGYSPAAAAGIVGNLHGESSMNPHAVGDNGTAFGLAQHRGPRFENLKKYAASQGKDWRDFDTNLGFIDHEMRAGLDPGAARAFQALQQAKTPEEATDLFMRHFERPSEASIAKSGPQRAAFAASLVRQGVAPARAVQIASASGAVPVPGAQPSAPQPGAPAAPQQVAQAGAGSTQPALPAPAPPQPIEVPKPDLSLYNQKIQDARALMANPRTRAAGFQLYTQAADAKAAAIMAYRKEAQAARAEHAKAQRAYELEMYKLGREDTRENRRIGLDERRLDNDDIRTSAAERGVSVQEQRLDFEKRKPMVAPLTSDVISADGRTVLRPGRERQSQGITVRSPDGTEMIVGGSGRPNTEQQSKWALYHRRGTQANTDLSRVESALTSLDETLVDRYAGDLGNFYTSEKFQGAKQAADSFLVTILRPDTGAAVTDTEFRIYGRIFLPRPGDKPATIAQKRRARETALEALKSGMSPADVLKAAAPQEFDGVSLLPRYVAQGGEPKLESAAKYRAKGPNNEIIESDDGVNWRPAK